MLLSRTQALILQIIAQHGFREMYGTEVLKASGGVIKLGTVHTTLRRMQDRGFLTSHQEEKPDDVSGIPRRLYQITGDGQRVLRAYEYAHGISDTLEGNLAIS